MDRYALLLLSCTVICTTAWSRPFYPVHRVRAPVRVTRFAPPPHQAHHSHHHRAPAPDREYEHQGHRPKRGYNDDHDHDLDQDRRETSGVTGPVHQGQRPKRGYYDDHDHDLDQDRRETSGVTGPVHTFVKTDKNANYKWGVRHHVGNKYAS